MKSSTENHLIWKAFIKIMNIVHYIRVGVIIRIFRVNFPKTAVLYGAACGSYRPTGTYEAEVDWLF